MVRYLHYLITDIQMSIEMAPKPLDADKLMGIDEEEVTEYRLANNNYQLPDLFGIVAEAFPPSSFLNEVQLDTLLINLEALWSAWLLRWDLPPNLSKFQQYEALRHAILHEKIAWHYELGGTVKICQHESDIYCPFGNGGHCHCKAMNEAARQDIEIWEEHVRSQGIDPYEELSEEAGAAFEAENRKRDLMKRSDDEWPLFDFLERSLDVEADNAILNEEPISNNGSNWLDVLFWENIESSAATNAASFEDDQVKPDEPLDGFFDDDYLNLTSL